MSSEGPRRLRELVEAQPPSPDRDHLLDIARRAERGDLRLEDVETLLKVHDPSDPTAEVTLSRLHPVDRALAPRVQGEQAASEFRRLGLLLLREVEMASAEPEVEVPARSRSWFRRSA